MCRAHHQIRSAEDEVLCLVGSDSKYQYRIAYVKRSAEDEVLCIPFYISGHRRWPVKEGDTSRRFPYKYRFFTPGRGHVPARGVFVVFDVPFPCAFSSCSPLSA